MNIEFDKVGTAYRNGYEVGRLRTARVGTAYRNGYEVGRLRTARLELHIGMGTKSGDFAQRGYIFEKTSESWLNNSYIFEKTSESWIIFVDTMNIEFDKVGTAYRNGYEVGRLRTARI